MTAVTVICIGLSWDTVYYNLGHNASQLPSCIVPNILHALSALYSLVSAHYVALPASGVLLAQGMPIHVLVKPTSNTSLQPSNCTSCCMLCLPVRQ